MPVIWTDKPEMHAAFITREIEKMGSRFMSVTNQEESTDALKALDNNRKIASDYLKKPNIGLCMGKQVHSARIAYVRRPGVIENTDGLVTDKPGLAIGVLVADCAAVLIADPVNKIIAAVHAGWRGSIEGIIPEAILQMEKIGAEPDLMHVYISPCISRQSFEVGNEVAAQFPERFVDRSCEKPHVDLRGFILQELIKAGVSLETVIQDDKCTTKHPDLLHSFRRDGEESGRMMAVVAISD